MENILDEREQKQKNSNIQLLLLSLLPVIIEIVGQLMFPLYIVIYFPTPSSFFGDALLIFMRNIIWIIAIFFILFFFIKTVQEKVILLIAIGGIFLGTINAMFIYINDDCLFKVIKFGNINYTVVTHLFYGSSIAVKLLTILYIVFQIILRIKGVQHKK